MTRSARWKWLTPFLGLAIKAASLARIAETLVETYLDATLAGACFPVDIERGNVTESRRCCGSVICATIPASSTPRRRRKLSRCSMTTLRPSFRRSTSTCRRLEADPATGVLPGILPPRNEVACAAALDAAGAAREAVAALNTRRFEYIRRRPKCISAHSARSFTATSAARSVSISRSLGPLVNEVSRMRRCAGRVDQPIRFYQRRSPILRQRDAHRLRFPSGALRFTRRRQNRRSSSRSISRARWLVDALDLPDLYDTMLADAGLCNRPRPWRLLRREQPRKLKHSTAASTPLFGPPDTTD